MSYLSFCVRELEEKGADQSSWKEVAEPPFKEIVGVLAKILLDRFGQISGRSVRSTWMAKMEAAAMPTSPVPAPSSRMRVCEVRPPFPLCLA